MAETSKRLGATSPAQLSAVAATIYTVPGATSCVLKHIMVSNVSGAELQVTISIGTDASDKRILNQVSVPVRDVLNLNVWIPLSTGEVIQAFASAAGGLNLTLSGVETT